ncbi:MAG TPA: mechanosensitive ion channel domain-containing protein [bacterium]|nr:mechanosensitive ion channel domain-containing protein [bacterium]
MSDFSNVPTMIKEYLAVYGLKIIGAGAILILGWWAAKIVRKIVRRLMVRGKVDETLIRFVTNLIYVALLAFVIVAALGKLGIQTTSFIAVLGAAGLAVGLALQGSLSNFAAGVLMIIFKPFKVGDFIDAAGKSGIVESIQIFTTKIRTADNKLVVIPNAKITGDSIVNYTAKETRRVDLVIGVSYSDNLDKVKNAIEAVLAADERILKDPAPLVGVLELADSSVNFAVRPWTKTADYWGVYFDTIKAIKERFDADGISIPFPQRDIHIIGEGGVTAGKAG